MCLHKETTTGTHFIFGEPLLLSGTLLAFFDVTGLDTLFESSTNTLQNTMQFVLAGLEPHLDTLNDTLKVLAIRIGNIVAFMPLALVIATVSLTDGLSQGRVRQANAARESAAIYHRAKYWRMGIIWLTCLTYFLLPLPFASRDVVNTPCFIRYPDLSASQIS